MFLFRLLREANFVSQKELAKVAETFGPCDRLLIDEAYKCTQLLISNIPEDGLKTTLEKSSRIKNQTSFGKGIKFSFPECNGVEPDLSIFEDDFEEEKPSFSMKLMFDSNNAESAKVPQEDREDWVQPRNPDDSGIEWLRNKCHIYFGNSGGEASSEDMCSAIYELLCSQRRDEEMQNELFELLGFERFDFIQELLAKRKVFLNTNTKDLTFNHINGLGKVNGLSGNLYNWFVIFKGYW